jgi:DNA (cytosine-5)-methyltransferase 1/site-specific DNA-methyltransferase (adenine-specific)
MLKILDLFSGVGGFSYGFEMTKHFKCVGHIEFDKQIANSFAKNHPDVISFVGDIKDISPLQVKEKIGDVDVIIGGPPCQGFSLKGKRKGLDDERNFLFKEYIKFVEYFNPKYFVLENVVAMLSDSNGYFKEEIKKAFEELGYFVSVGILNSLNFGVPQNRKRAIFIGSSISPISLPKGSSNIVTTWDAISDLAYLESGEGEFESEYKLPIQSEYQKIMRKNSFKLYNHKATKHSNIALDRLKRIPPECGKEYLTEKISSTFGQTWGRLEKNKPSPTIITRFDTPSNGKNSHPYLHRAITPREAARIQSFPDDFIFYGSKSSVIKQIGNAVPPLMAKEIATHIFKHYTNVNLNINNIYCLDAIQLLKQLKDNQVDLLLTDIPYEKVNKKSNGLRNLDKKDANTMTFNLDEFLKEVFRVTKGSGYIFCGKEQVSQIYQFFDEKGISTRLMIWEKTNPSPMNCQYIWMSGIETFVYFKKRKATFNEHYKNSVIRFPNGSSKIHPTQKPLKLFEYLIEVSSNKGDLICDPFVGSGTTAIAAKKLCRNYICSDINEKYVNISKERINEVKQSIE